MDILSSVPGSIFSTTVGVFLIWIFLAIVTAVAQELVESKLQWKTKILEETIKSLLFNNDNLIREFYAHPLIRSLGLPNKKVDYITGELFGEVLVDLLISNDIKIRQRSKTSYIFDLKNGLSKLNAIAPEITRAITTQLRGIEEGDNDNGFSESKMRIGKWYDRVWARAVERHMFQPKITNAIIAISIAFLLNIDTIAFANYLWRESYIRELAKQTIVAQASQIPSDPLKPLAKQLGLEMFSLPLGWRDEYIPDKNNLNGWGIKISGIVISGLAAAQIAPFSFALMKKIVNTHSNSA